MDINTPIIPADTTAPISQDNFLQFLATSSGVQATFFERLIEMDKDVSLELAEALEDLGNRYISMSEHARSLALDEIGYETKPLV